MEVKQTEAANDDSLDIFSEFATDTTKELEGAWTPLFEGKKAEVLVARLGNRNYARELAEEIEKNQTALNEKDESGKPTKAADDLSDSIMAKVLAKTILLGWRHMNYKGAAYSTETAEAALAHADFRRAVMTKAGRFDVFKAALEEQQGNV